MLFIFRTKINLINIASSFKKKLDQWPLLYKSLPNILIKTFLSAVWPLSSVTLHLYSPSSSGRYKFCIKSVPFSKTVWRRFRGRCWLSLKRIKNQKWLIRLSQSEMHIWWMKVTCNTVQLDSNLTNKPLSAKLDLVRLS